MSSNNESNNAFPFELDPSILPQLHSKGDNYAEWREAWTIAFQYVELWDLVSGTSRPPTPLSPAASEQNVQIKKWSQDNNKALVMLMSTVHPDLVTGVTSASSASQAWTALQDRFDRDTARSIIQQFRQLVSMRYKESGELTHHLDAFHQAWTRLECRCRTSNQELGKNMTAVFSSDSIKGSFFFSTLPQSMDNIVDNLLARGINKFVDIEPEMLGIAHRRR